MSELDELRARVRRLEDERAVVDTLAQYCHALDYKERDAFLDAFTEEGVFRYRRNDDREWRFEIAGRAALGPWFDRHEEGSPRGEENHLIVNPRVTVDGDRARAVSQFFTIRERGGAAALQTTGRFVDRLVRCSDGRWRIEERQAIGEIAVPFVAPPTS